MEYALRAVMVGKSRQPLQGMGTSVPLICCCIAAASVMEHWIGLGPEAVTHHKWTPLGIVLKQEMLSAYLTGCWILSPGTMKEWWLHPHSEIISHLADPQCSSLLHNSTWHSPGRTKCIGNCVNPLQNSPTIQGTPDSQYLCQDPPKLAQSLDQQTFKLFRVLHQSGCYGKQKKENVRESGS